MGENNIGKKKFAVKLKASRDGRITLTSYMVFTWESIHGGVEIVPLI